MIQIIELLTDPLTVIIIIWLVASIIGGIWARKPKDKAAPPKKGKTKAEKVKPAKFKGPMMKQLKKMIGETEKGKSLSVPSVRTRQEIITQIFLSKMNQINLTPSTDSGYVPVSSTPLARFLKDRGVADDTIDAIIAGLMEEEHEAEVRNIIDAASDSPEVNLIGNELDEAKELAVDEWRKLRESGKT
ncbi:MAG: hypothetical protein ACFFDV_03670 [Candidatus Thorarchaeota archaeon]